MSGIPHEREPEAEGAAFDGPQGGRRSVRQLHLKEFHSVKTKFMRPFQAFFGGPEIIILESPERIRADANRQSAATRPGGRRGGRSGR
jgi:hypothetical protein